MSSCEIQEEADQTILHIEGEATIHNAVEMYEAMKRLHQTGKPIVLDTKHITEADVSFLQLICSLHRTCVHGGQSMELSSPISIPVLSAVVSAGYLRFKGCTFAGNVPCLWQRRQN